MASRNIKLAAVASFAVLAGMGYYLYSAIAQTAAPQLAHAPLNAARQITPAFIMAVDDSGSMDFETLFPTNDGSAWWHSTNDSFIGLNRTDVAAAGVLNFNRAGAADNTWKKYPYVFPFGDGSIADGRRNGDATNDHFAIPAIPAYGYARSPDVNRAYFDPIETYRPWVESTGQFLQGVAGINATTGQVNPESAPADPKRGSFRLNLTSDFTYGGDANARFMFYGGMVMPSGTRYKEVNCANGGSIPAAQLTADTNAGLDGAGYAEALASRTIGQTGATSRCSISIRYYPATFYILASRADAVAAAIGYNTGNIVDDGAQTPDGQALRRFQIRSDHFGNGANYTATINNFANWFTYYRKRHQAARAALTLAFDDQNMRVRAGYFQINGRNTVTMRNMNVAADRTAIYNSFYGLNTNGGTPNKEAVKHMGGQFARSYVAGTSPVQLSCQKNFGMLFTDGFSNNASTSVANVDGSDAAMFPSPLSDGVADTMADIAAYYYKNSLGSGFPPTGGKVAVDSGCSSATPDPRLDCQTVPHMNFYGVTLGAQGLVYGSPGFEAQTSNPWANPPSWPTEFYNRHPSAVDDLWHATLNGRGKFINAATSTQLVNAIREVVTAVTASATPSGSYALTGSRVGTGSLSVEPFYEAVNSTDWYGKLTARTPAADPTTGAITFTSVWEASEKLPAAASRNIKFGRTGTSVAPTVRDFTLSGLTAAGITTLAPLCANTMAPASCTTANLNALDVTVAQAVDYLRGGRSLEGGKLRARTGVLGDIVNSSPIISSATDDYGYRTLGGTLGTTYATYLESKKTANRSMVYVGANDGMFHAFNAADGVEKLAYIPATAVGHLGNLLFPRIPDPSAAQKFDHRYYVDGHIAVSDAYINGAWKTVAVVSAGAGGRSVFALDVTNPDSITVLWEVNNLIGGTTTFASRIGHVLGKPVIVPVKSSATGDPEWKAIFGNGYNSASQRATLFMVDIRTGAVDTIVAQEAATSDAPAYNGLGNVVVLDRNRFFDGTRPAGRDGFADTAYGADQNGAIWKFDLVDRSVGLSGKPLFVARDSTGKRQPITGGLEAAAGPGSAAMIFFGTGSFAFQNDGSSNDPQTLYSIIDRGVEVTGRDQLLAQTVGAVSGAYRATSTSSIAGTHAGWYLDLPTGQRVVSYPRVESGVIFFPVYEPSTESTNPCEPGGANWLYGLNALSGAAALSDVRVGSPTGAKPSLPSGTPGALKLDSPGTAPITEVAVMTTPRVSPLTSTDPDDLAAALASRCSMVVQVAGAPPLYLPRPCGRQSWRQVR